MKIAIFFGSKSDEYIFNNAKEILKKFRIHYKCYIISAHRIPDILSKTIDKIEKDKQVEVIIAGAGLSAHLPGIISSRTSLPVIGIPISNNSNIGFGGLDALFSIVQMPSGVPVATVGINNSYNAAILAIRILSIKYDNIKSLFIKFRTNMQTKLKKEIENKL